MQLPLIPEVVSLIASVGLGTKQETFFILTMTIYCGLKLLFRYKALQPNN